METYNTVKGDQAAAADGLVPSRAMDLALSGLSFPLHEMGSYRCCGN